MRQMKLGKEITKDLTSKGKPRNKTQLLVDSGYSAKTAEGSTAVIFRQEGTINAINVALESAGLSEAKADEVVQSILTDKHEEGVVRLKAADLVYKRSGSYAAEKSISLNVNTDELKTLIVEDMLRFRGKTQ